MSNRQEIVGGYFLLARPVYMGFIITYKPIFLHSIIAISCGFVRIVSGFGMYICLCGVVVIQSQVQPIYYRRGLDCAAPTRVN